MTVGKLRLLKSAGIYGANASGKSNLIKAIDTMKDLVKDSAGFEPERELAVTPFLLNGKSAKKPSVFEVVFLNDGVKYQYGFAATRKHFQKEWLIAYPKGIGQTWYERTLSDKESNYDWKYSTYLKGDKKKLAEKTRDNALFLSVGAQWNNEQLTNVYKWFKDSLRIAPPRESFIPVTAKMLLDVEKAKGEARKELYESIIESMQDADLGIKGVNIIKRSVDKDKLKFPDDMPNEVREEILKRLSRPKVEMVHRNMETGKDVLLPLEEESDGTQRFFQLLGPFFQTVALGYTVFIDELEAHLHPLLTREIIRFIQNPEYNKNGAQLIFATHDVTLLDPELFRRDQIWFTEKEKNGGTKLYSMSDYKERRPRKGEAMQKGYLAGRYGAIPIIESFRISHG
jgi:AAA15 family ATPase/GTPase